MKKILLSISITIIIVFIVIPLKPDFFVPLSLGSPLSRGVQQKEWTEKELQDKMPDYIKNILVRDRLITWRRFHVKDNDHSRRTFYGSKEISLHCISVLYVSKDEVEMNTILTDTGQKDGKINHLTIYPAINIKNLYPEKRAEAVFLQDTGKMIEFKTKEAGSGQWITLFNAEEQAGI